MPIRKNTPRYGAQLERKAFYAKIDRERAKQLEKLKTLKRARAQQERIDDAEAALQTLSELRWFASWRQYRIRARKGGL